MQKCPICSEPFRHGLGLYDEQDHNDQHRKDLQKRILQLGLFPKDGPVVFGLTSKEVYDLQFKWVNWNILLKATKATQP